jgi:hypothetical protein
VAEIFTVHKWTRTPAPALAAANATSPLSSRLHISRLHRPRRAVSGQAATSSGEQVAPLEGSAAGPCRCRCRCRCRCGCRRAATESKAETCVDGRACFCGAGAADDAQRVVASTSPPLHSSSLCACRSWFCSIPFHGKVISTGTVA